MRFGLIMLSEYVRGFAACGTGRPAVPRRLGLGPSFIWPEIWFLIKMFLVFGIWIWVRGALMRVTTKQILGIGWKRLHAPGTDQPGDRHRAQDGGVVVDGRQEAQGRLKPWADPAPAHGRRRPRDHQAPPSTTQYGAVPLGEAGHPRRLPWPPWAGHGQVHRLRHVRQDLPHHLHRAGGGRAAREGQGEAPPGQPGKVHDVRLLRRGTAPRTPCSSTPEYELAEYSRQDLIYDPFSCSTRTAPGCHVDVIEATPEMVSKALVGRGREDREGDKRLPGGQRYQVHRLLQVREGLPGGRGRTCTRRARTRRASPSSARKFDTEKCVGCEKCLDNCPKDAITMKEVK